MRKRIGMVWLLLVGISLLLLPRNAAAQDFSDFLEKGTREYGIATGHGWSFGGSDRVKTIPVNVHWGQVISDRKGSSWYRGCWEVLAEGTFNYLYHNRHQYGIGLTGLLRYNFARESAWVPFVQGGIGLWHSNIDYPNFPNDLNFSPQAGVGLQYFICTCMSFHVEYRIQHFSNASTRSDNPGLDFNNVLAGISWYY